MDRVLADVKRVACCFDIVLVIGSNGEEHLRNLSNVFQKFQQHGLCLNKKNTSFSVVSTAPRANN